MTFFDSNDLITGYYGHTNFGDDLFCDILYNALKSEKKLKPKIVKCGSKSPSPICKVSSSVNNLLNARSVTLGGGSILGMRSKISNRGLEYLFSNASLISYNAIGVGIQNPKGIIPKSMIESMDFVGLRSIKEYDQLSKSFNNIHFTADIAYSLSNYMSINRKTKLENSVAVIVTDIGFIGSRGKNELLDFTKNMIASFPKDTIFNVYNFQRSRLEDKILFKNLTNCLTFLKANFEYIEHHRTFDTVNSLAKNNFIISDRLHGAIISHILDIPFILSNHHPKCYDFLVDINYPYIPKNDYQISSYLVDSLSPSSNILKDSKINFEVISKNAISSWAKSLIS